MTSEVGRRLLAWCPLLQFQIIQTEGSIRQAGINGQHSLTLRAVGAEGGGAQSLCSTRLISEALFVSLVRAEEE